MRNFSVIIAAGGSSTRMGNGISKQLLILNGMPVIEHSIKKFSDCERVNEIIIVSKKSEIELIRSISDKYYKVKCVIAGGNTRAESVFNGFNALSDECEYVAIHDASRPNISEIDIEEIFDDAEKSNSVCPVTKCYDTLKKANENLIVSNTLNRDEVFGAVTPQVFKKDIYAAAIEKTDLNTFTFTDDSSIVEKAGFPVKLHIIKNDNKKITVMNDYNEMTNTQPPAYRVGHGYDVHRLVAGRKLILCGEEIPFELGLDGHSDADVALHAIMDALLGASGERDIGYHFPDNDDSYKGISSILLLKKVNEIIISKGYTIENIDCTIIAQKPKLSPFIEKMRENVANTLSIDKDRINIKATTEEKLGFTGNLEGISSHAVCMIKK